TTKGRAGRKAQRAPVLAVDIHHRQLRRAIRAALAKGERDAALAARCRLRTQTRIGEAQRDQRHGEPNEPYAQCAPEFQHEIGTYRATPGTPRGRVRSPAGAASRRGLLLPRLSLRAVERL